MTTRSGGVSHAPYHNFNLGDHVGDNATNVQINRDELKRRIGAKPAFLKQVHGCDVLHLNASTQTGVVADAVVTTTQGLACTIMVADCLPILFSDTKGTCIAALHAGWRGLAMGVVEATMNALRQCSSESFMAWMGPCIGPQAFEVGTEVREAFLRTGWSSQKASEACFEPLGGSIKSDKYLADLPALATLALKASGVHGIYGNDGSGDWCTVSNPSKFFSHRRDSAARGGDIRSTGRMAAAVWLSNS